MQTLFIFCFCLNVIDVFIVKTDLDKEIFHEYCFICILRYAIVHVEAMINLIVAI